MKPPMHHPILSFLLPLCLLNACALSLSGQAEFQAQGPQLARESLAPSPSPKPGQESPAPSPSSKPANHRPSPWPALAFQPPLACPEDDFSTRSIPSQAFDAQGLPLPAALCLGARIDALPMLQGLMHQSQAASEGLVQAEGPAMVYEEGEARLLLRLQQSSTPRIAGAWISATHAQGLSAQAAQAWLRALAPCAEVPDFSASASWYLELSAAKTPGFEADQIRMMASQEESPEWRAELKRLLGDDTPKPGLAPQVPPQRFLGVVAMAYYLRQ